VKQHDRRRGRVTPVDVVKLHAVAFDELPDRRVSAFRELENRTFPTTRIIKATSTTMKVVVIFSFCAIR
jgi:hypothetical protein